MPLVEAEAVSKDFIGSGGAAVHAVVGVSLSIDPGQTLGLIGESGSGKSTMGRILLALVRPDSGRVRFDGVDLTSLSTGRLRRLRSRFQVVFQEPLESLNPRMSVGDIVAEPLIVHERSLGRGERRLRVKEVLDQVGLNESFADRYPRDLSGGQQQRVGIARAIVTRPKFVVLDEPTSSLDLSVRALILNLLGSLQKEFGLSYLLISHDIATVRHFCTHTAVMYLGRVVEYGPTAEVISRPRHPYTRALLSAALSVDPDERPPHYPLSGDIPSPTDVPPGCPLVGRCPIEIPECSERPVPLRQIEPGHFVACVRAEAPGQ